MTESGVDLTRIHEEETAMWAMFCTNEVKLDQRRRLFQ